MDSRQDLNFWILLIKRNKTSNWLENTDILGVILNKFSSFGFSVIKCG